MEPRDRIANLGLLGGALLAWGLVLVIVLTRDPIADPTGGLIGAIAIGLACGLTAAPLLWLVVFARNGRIAYRRSWLRAGRRAGWVAIVVALLVELRLQGALELPIALFVLVMVGLAEVTLSSEPGRYR